MKKLISLFLTFALLLSGCNPASSTKATEDNKEFTKYLDTFVQEMSKDYIVLHQYFEHPEEYGINPKNAEISLGSFIEDNKEEDKLEKQLIQFDIHTLSPRQKVIYNELRWELKIGDRLNNKNYQYLTNIWSSMSGVHQNLIQFFSEYDIRQEQDIQPLLTLIQDVPRYTKEAIDYSKEQANRNLLSFDYDTVLEDCQQFLNTQNTSAIKKNLNKEVEALHLKENKKNEYKKEIENSLDTYLYPSYKTIINELKKLKKDVQPLQGLANYKNGKNFYVNSIQEAIGTKNTISKIEQDLEQGIENSTTQAQKILLDDFDAYDHGLSYKTSFKSIEDILPFLEKNYKKEFPKLKSMDYELQPLAKEQSNEGIMAYFVIPPVDVTQNYRIRYNKVDYGNAPSSVEMYSTLAHEGIPGHMYQSQYNHEHFFHPIQYFMGNLGFTEGYATYIELESLNFLNFEKNAKMIYRCNTEISNFYIALMDIDIHYHGLSLKEFTNKYKEIFGSDLKDVYFQLCDNPGAFLPYYYGYYEIQSLKSKAEKSLGNNFDPVQFHEALLQSGSMNFDIITNNIEQYIKEE